MKRVLILGDSISMGYRELVKTMLDGQAEVYYYEENGSYSAHTLWLANQWVRNNGAPDIVHWNNGIWDICAEPPIDGSFTPVWEYLDHLKRIAELLYHAGTEHIIFATTTYQKPEQWNMTQEKVDQYNALARALMETMGVEINDLGALTRDRVQELVCEDNTHLTEQGYQLCAQEAVRLIKAYL